MMGSLMANLDMTGARIEAVQKHARYAEGLGMRLHTHTHTQARDGEGLRMRLHTQTLEMVKAWE